MQPQFAGKICPACGRAWPLQASGCTCGHQFRTQFAANPPLQQTQLIPKMMPVAARRGTARSLAWAVGAFIVVLGLLGIGRATHIGRSDVDAMSVGLHVGMSEMEVLDKLGEPTGKADFGGFTHRWVYPASNGELRIDFFSSSIQKVRAFHFISESQWSQVKVGMPRDDVDSIMGKPDYEDGFAFGLGRSSQGYQRIHYGDGEIRMSGAFVSDVCAQGCEREQTQWPYGEPGGPGDRSRYLPQRN